MCSNYGGSPVFIGEKYSMEIDISPLDSIIKPAIPIIKGDQIMR